MLLSSLASISTYRQSLRRVFDGAELCGELLRVTPPADALRGSAISIQWLCDQLSTPAPDADEVTLEQSARGFILAVMGSFLFAAKKGVHVHLYFLPLLQDLTHNTTYSWGGAVLAHTYRELCRANLDRRCGISCCITLIQVCNIFSYYIHIHIHNTSLGCLLSVYFIFSYDLGRDFTWDDQILGDQQHIQHYQSLMPYMMTMPMSSMETWLRLSKMDYQLSQSQSHLFHWGVGGEYL